METQLIKLPKPVKIKCYSCRKKQSSYIMRMEADYPYPYEHHTCYVLICLDCVHQNFSEEDIKKHQAKEV